MSWRRGLELGTVSVLTAAGYVVLYQVQRSLSDNGLATSTPNQFPRTDVDLSRAAHDMWTNLSVVALQCLLYAWVLFRAARWNERASVCVLVAFPLIVQILFLLLRPTLSIDAYSYLAHGYLATQPSLNPYVQEAASVSALPYGEYLRTLGWLPMHPQSPYGPAWTQIERLVVVLTGSDLVVARILIKLPALVAAWGSALLIFVLVRRVAPSLRWVALAGWLWSPIVIIEFAGDGHNDAIMIFFVLLALYCCARGWAYRAALALGLAVLIKYLPVIFAAPVLTALLRRAPSVRSVLGRVALGAVTTLVVAALAFGRYWVGSATFVGVSASGRPYPAWTPTGMIVTYVPYWTGGTAAPVVTQRIVAGLLLLLVLAVSYRVRTTRDLLRSSAVIALASFALLPGGWPWYAALPLATLLCLPTMGTRLLVLVLTLTTRSVATFGNLQVLGAVPLESTLDIDGFVGVTLPVLICLPVAIWLWLREGRTDLELTAPADRPG